MNTPVREGETIEGSRTTRNRPYPVLKCSSDVEALYNVKSLYILRALRGLENTTPLSLFSQL